MAHGWVAYKMGDPTAKFSDRLTFNPLSHLDPIGTLALFVAGFGWAKPVPVNFNNLRNQRKGVILVSSAGALANILLAFVALLLIRLFSGSSSEIAIILVHGVCRYVAYVNITLAALNLIPIPPLDGSKILMGILWEKTPYFFSRLEPYGFFIIIGLLFLGILDPLIGFIGWVIRMLIAMIIP